MSDVTVSFRIDKRLHERMKKHDEINWSAVLRNTVEDLTKEFDPELARRAGEAMDRMREEDRKRQEENARRGIKEKTSLEIIHEWREKRLRKLLTPQ